MKNKILKLSLAAAVIIATATSCKKSFLDENLSTVRDLSFYKTDAGIQQLCASTCLR